PGLGARPDCFRPGGDQSHGWLLYRLLCLLSPGTPGYSTACALRGWLSLARRIAVMSDTVMRLVILLLVCLATWLIVWSGRRFVANQRHHALAAPLPDTLLDNNSSRATPAANTAPVRILAFSSEDC